MKIKFSLFTLIIISDLTFSQWFWQNPLPQGNPLYGVQFIKEEEIDEIATEFILSQNYPNPFNPTTKINYSIHQSTQVTVKLFDILGNEIETLVNEEKLTGTYEITWNAENISSGVYLYRIQAGDFVQSKKMVFMK